MDVLQTKVVEYTDEDARMSDLALNFVFTETKKKVICSCACTEGNTGEPCIEATAGRAFGDQLWGVGWESG